MNILKKYNSYKDCLSLEQCTDHFDNDAFSEILQYHSFFYSEHIYNFYKDLMNSGKSVDNFDGNDLWKF
jgi:hypothetical protein